VKRVPSPLELCFASEVLMWQRNAICRPSRELGIESGVEHSLPIRIRMLIGFPLFLGMAPEKYFCSSVTLRISILSWKPSTHWMNNLSCTLATL
jgi:hypothetical protein